MSNAKTFFVFPEKITKNDPKKDDKEFGLWANEQAVTSIILLFFGGIVGVAGMFDKWQFAASVIPASFLLFLIEWPRGSRKNGKTTLPRRFQNRLSALVRNIAPLRNYYLRAIISIIVCVPSCFLLPTIIGGLCLFISGIIYLAAAINGEEWKPQQTTKIELTNPAFSPPHSPPPRNPQDAKV